MNEFLCATTRSSAPKFYFIALGDKREKIWEKKVPNFYCNLRKNLRKKASSFIAIGKKSNGGGPMLLRLSFGFHSPSAIAIAIG